MQKLISKVWKYQEASKLNKIQEKKFARLFLSKRTRIYDKKYILSARKKPNTIVIDLDGTMLILNKETEKTYLRKSFFKSLQKAKKSRRIRLVLWSAASQEYVKSKVMQYPKLITLFDEVICAENYRINTTIVSEEIVSAEEKKLKKFRRKINKRISASSDETDTSELESLAKDLKRALRFRKRFDEGKNLALVNYKLLIDNAPSVRTQAILSGHHSLHIPTVDWNYISKSNISTIIKFEKFLEDTYQLIIDVLDSPELASETIKKFQKKIYRLTKPTRLYNKIFFRRKFV